MEPLVRLLSGRGLKININAWVHFKEACNFSSIITETSTMTRFIQTIYFCTIHRDEKRIMTNVLELMLGTNWKHYAYVLNDSRTRSPYFIRVSAWKTRHSKFSILEKSLHAKNVGKCDETQTDKTTPKWLIPWKRKEWKNNLICIGAKHIQINGTERNN